jgi:type II secretory pathway pseudopilin PulG
MLVVSGIIAILAGIALPVLSRSRTKADRAVCLSNLQQIGVAIRAYADDWNDTFPAAWNEWNTPQYASFGPFIEGTPGIIEAVSPYGAAREIWRCPSDTGLNLKFSDYWMTGPARPFWKDGGASYFYRDMYARVVDENPYPKPENSALAARPTSVVARPTRVVLITDVLPWHSPPQGRPAYMEWDGLTVSVYCDGHAAARPWNEVRANIVAAPGLP